MGLDCIEAPSPIRNQVAMQAAHTMLLASDYFVGSNASSRVVDLTPHRSPQQTAFVTAFGLMIHPPSY